MSKILYDSFTDSAGTLLQNHTGESGNKWSLSANASPGAQAIISTSGEVRWNTAPGIYSIYDNDWVPTSAEYNVFFEVVFHSLTNCIFQVATRLTSDWSSAGGYYSFTYIQNPGDPASSTLYIAKTIGGTQTTLGTATYQLSSALKYQFQTWNGHQQLLSSSNNGATWTNVITTTDSDAALTSAGSVGFLIADGASTGATNTGLAIKNFGASLRSSGWVFPPDFSPIVLSPGNQKIVASTSAQWMHNATSLKCNFTGTSVALPIDVSVWTTGVKPKIWSSVDGGAWVQSAALSGSSLSIATGLTDTTHTLETRLDVAAADESDTWTPADSFNVLGVQTDPGRYVYPPTGNATARPKRAMIFGDSITRGYAATNPPLAGFAAIVAHGLNAETGIVGHSGQGWLNAASDGHTPNFVNAFIYYFSGAARIWPTLDYLIVCHGTNDGYSSKAAIAAAVQAWLASARTYVQTNTLICIVAPFDAKLVTTDSLSIQSAISAGVAAYQMANPSDQHVIFCDGSTRNYGYGNGTSQYNATGDGVHPTTEGHALEAADIVSMIQSQIASSSGGVASSVTRSTGQSRLSGRQVTRSTGNSRARGTQVSLSTGNAVIGN